MSNWYVYIDSETQGPFSDEKIKEMIQSGKITNEMNVMKEGTKEWLVAGAVPELQGKTAPSKKQSPSSSPSQSQPKEDFMKNVIDEEGLCPTCGYFTGSLLTCPRCGARVKNKIALSVVKKISIIGSFIGVIFLWLAAYYKQPTLIKVAEVDEQMNGAYVTIVGKVVSYNEDEGKDTLKMKIDDGSGQPIGVNAFKKLKQIKQLFGSDENMPAVGDLVQVTGVLNITDKFGVSMFLQIPERLQVTEKFQMKEIKIGDLKKENIDEIVKLKAHIISVSERTTKKGTKMYIINLGDETGRIGMTIFEAAFEKLPPETKELLTTVGTEFETAIRIGEYRGEFQATILDYTKIKKLGTVEISEAEAASASANSGSSGFSNGMSANVKSSDIGDLNESSVNNVYKVKAGIAKFAKRKTKKGKDMYSLKLTDKTGSINVTIFDGDYNSMSASVKKIIETEGNEIEVALKISEYNGRIQGGIADVNSIKKTGTFDLDKSEDGEEESPKYKKKQDASEDAPVKKIGELTLADKGKSVKIEGAEIKFVSSNDKGMNLTLGDDSGKIKIMIWENMIEKIPGLADVEKGASISGIFAVDAYNEKLQLKIKNPKSIKIE